MAGMTGSFHGMACCDMEHNSKFLRQAENDAIFICFNKFAFHPYFMKKGGF
jgi:hypothetical protein